MRQFFNIEFKPGTKEEQLPDYSIEFPCVTTFSELPGNIVQELPWHWHNAVEIFYVERGIVEFYTPTGILTFPAGSGGWINANVLHRTTIHSGISGHRRMQHLFDASFISGSIGSRIEKEYVLPMLTATHLEVLPLMPDNPEHTAILEKLQRSFQHSSNEKGHELRIRSMLSEIWLDLLKLAQPQLSQKHKINKAPEQIKQMLIFIHEHYGEKITTADIAASAFISERACHNLFQKCLHTTPGEYVNSYRMSIAFQMLAQTEESITAISAACGMNNSYFCKKFREITKFTPLEYRRFYQRKQEESV